MIFTLINSAKNNFRTYKVFRLRINQFYDELTFNITVIVHNINKNSKI